MSGHVLGMQSQGPSFWVNGRRMYSGWWTDLHGFCVTLGLSLRLSLNTGTRQRVYLKCGADSGREN